MGLKPTLGRSLRPSVADNLAKFRATSLEMASVADAGSSAAEADTMLSGFADLLRPSMSLDLDFAGRVKKIRAPLAHSLHALFEAVANSFDSTEHLGHKARISVRILRQEVKALFSSPEKEYVLTGYEIEDNGVGFTDQNMEYFKRSDTMNKVGGKGVGRLLWLKIFDNVNVASTYKENGDWRKREFPFSFSKKGVDDADIASQKLKTGECKTTIGLENPKRDRLPYLVQDPQELAARLLEHFLLYFAVLKGPQLRVFCDYVDSSIDVGHLYKETIGNRHKLEDIEVDGQRFSLHHLFVKPTTTRKNLIRICARRRVVMTDTVASVVPEVSVSQAVTLHQAYRYHAYVTGDYFDENTNDERSEVRFAKAATPKEEAEEAEPQATLLVPEEVEQASEGVTKEALTSELADRIRKHLSEHIANVRMKKEKQLEDFANKEQPQFRPFVSIAKKHVERLPARPNKRDLEVALYLAKMEGRDELEKSVAEIVNKVESAEHVQERRRELVDRFASEANRHAISALAEYVCTRRAVIDVLKSNLGKQDGSYEYEGVIHDLIFPRHITSDDIPVGPLDAGEREIENLWLLDERLVFHRLLTSDKPLSTLKQLLVANRSVQVDFSDKNDEPDILIFDPALVTAENDCFETLGIVEFKRPGRDDYTLAKNPIQQIIEIARKIKDAKQVETRTGAIQGISGNVRFYGYAVCDVTSSLRPIIEDSYRMQHTPDGIGYYAFHDNLNLLIEVIPYSRIVSDAERRNAAFFKKLGM